MSTYDPCLRVQHMNGNWESFSEVLIKIDFRYPRISPGQPDESAVSLRKTTTTTTAAGALLLEDLLLSPCRSINLRQTKHLMPNVTMLIETCTHCVKPTLDS